MSIAPNMILFGTWMETTALSTPESLMMIGNIMISCRIALLLSHRCRDMRFLHISIQFPIRMLMPSRRQEVSLSLRNYHRKNRLFELRDKSLPNHVTEHRSFVHKTNMVLSLCPLFPPSSDERGTLRRFVHFRRTSRRTPPPPGRRGFMHIDCPRKMEASMGTAFSSG